MEGKYNFVDFYHISQCVYCAISLHEHCFLLICDIAWAVCPVGHQAVFVATKQEVTLTQYKGTIAKLAYKAIFDSTKH